MANVEYCDSIKCFRPVSSVEADAYSGPDTTIEDLRASEERERAAASSAQSTVARRAHLKLADAYADLVATGAAK